MRVKRLAIFLLAVSFLLCFIGVASAGTLYLCRPNGVCDIASTNIPSGGTGYIYNIPSSSVADSCTVEGTYQLKAVYSGASTITANAYNINWDSDQADCECLGLSGEKNTQYKSNAASNAMCCGDDGDADGGYLTSDQTFVCIPSEPNTQTWIHRSSPSTRPGDIFHITNGDYDVVSDGENWYACAAGGSTGNFNGIIKQEGDLQWIEGHQYLCYNHGGSSGLFAECRGDYSTVNQGSAKTEENIFSTGQGVIVGSSAYYCSKYAEWSEGIADESTCLSAGFEWTGSRCCGITGNEFYNDLNWDLTYTYPSQSGGCFKNTKIDHNTLISDGNSVRDGDFSSQDVWTLEGTAIYESEKLKIRQGEGKAYQEITDNVVSGSSYTLAAYIDSTVGCSPYVKIGSDELTETGSINFTMPSGTITIEAGAYDCGSSDFAYIDNIQLSFADSAIINFEGSFYGCNKEYDYQDDVNEDDLVSKSDLCSVKSDYFCSPEEGGRWVNSAQGAPNSSSRDTLSSVPDSVRSEINIPDSCCPENWCWTGTECTQESYNFNNITDPDTYGCIDGTWKPATQADWEGKLGYCPRESDCLVDLAGNPESNDDPSLYAGAGNSDNPQCISDSQFIGDHICSQGTWTSRTGAVATQLLSFVEEQIRSDEYTLFCDYYTNVLPEYDYTDIETFLKGDEFKPPYEGISCGGIPFECVNNFCVLKYDEDGQKKTAFGVALNKPVNDVKYSFLETLGKPYTYCDYLVDTGTEFMRCSETDNTIWYSDKYDSLIYSLDGLDNIEEPEQAAFQEFIKGPLSGLLDYVFGISIIVPPGEEMTYTFVKDIKDYNRVYINKKDGKEIKAVLEEPTPFYLGEQPEGYPEFFAINFKGVETDICPTINQFRTQKQQYTTNCTYIDNLITDDEIYIVGTEEEILDMWPELTSRLRLN